MYICQVAAYIPDTLVPNAHFAELNGLSDEWITARTGIQTRRKASPDENTNTLACEAVKRGLAVAPFAAEEIDLIVGATYTPYDTIHSLAHAVQNMLNISDIPVVSISTACSSFVNAIEIVQGYFAMGKARKALVIVADHNTAYSDERDTVGGHLWGDGATAVWVSATPISDRDWRVRDIITGGAGSVGKAPEGVFMRPNDGRFVMKYGKDVFLNACTYMAKVTQDILAKNNYTVADVDFFVPHQANLRITKNVAQTLGLAEEKALSNIQYLGNTGCAGCAIALYEHQHRFEAGNLIALTVFGGGYSYGSMLIECC